jgi:uncharacterized protein (TIGR00255 family)
MPMLASMTGFARVSATVDNVSYNLEIKALNGKYFKASIKLPEQLLCYEPRIEQQLRDSLLRGTIIYNLRTRDNSEQSMYEVSTLAIKNYLSAIDSLQEKDSGKNRVVDLSNILLLPGVCQYPEPDPARLEKELQIITDLTKQAAQQLWTMRYEEGKHLTDDLKRNLEKIKESKKIISERAPLVIQDYAQKLHQKVTKLLSSAEVELNQQDLAREVAIYAERSDVNEELSRLESHLQQFAALIDGKDHSGRTLEFLAQELLRETNTIGSKANDAQIAQWVVEIKGCIDRIKEQVLNVV